MTTVMKMVMNMEMITVNEDGDDHGDELDGLVMVQGDDQCDEDGDDHDDHGDDHGDEDGDDQVMNEDNARLKVG